MALLLVVLPFINIKGPARKLLLEMKGTRSVCYENNRIFEDRFTTLKTAGQKLKRCGKVDDGEKKTQTADEQ